MPPHTEKKTVLVTGAAGFIGSWVADTLLARGDDVVIVDEVRKLADASVRSRVFEKKYLQYSSKWEQASEALPL